MAIVRLIIFVLGIICLIIFSFVMFPTVVVIVKEYIFMFRGCKMMTLHSL